MLNLIVIRYSCHGSRVWKVVFQRWVTRLAEGGRDILCDASTCFRVDIDPFARNSVFNTLVGR